MEKASALFFIALVPPPGIRLEIEGLKQHISEKYHTKGALRSPTHITLQMPFRLHLQKEPTFTEELQAFATSQKGFELVLDGFNAFPPRVIFIDVQAHIGLQKLQQALAKFMKLNFQVFGANYRDQAFKPHVTLAFRDLKKPAFFQAWETLKDQPLYYQFPVKALALLKHSGRCWDIYREFDLGEGAV